MNARKDEQWLDEPLRRTVNGTTPVFDAQAWKQKYADEYRVLVARGRHRRGRGLPHRFRSFGKFAIAAAVVTTASVLFIGRFGTTQSTSRPQSGAQESPAQMVSLLSLSAAFQSGGMEGLDKQCDRAVERLGPPPTHVSLQELLKNINSKG